MSEAAASPVAATDAAVVAASTGPEVAPDASTVQAAPEPATVSAEAPVEVVVTTSGAASVDADALVESVDASEVKAGLENATKAAIAEAEEPAVPDTVDLPPAELRGVIEALLLVSTKPLTVERLVALLPGATAAWVEGFLAGLSERYRREGRGWDLRSLSGGWQLLTRPDFHPWVRQLDRKELPTRLTRSAMETLAIVAYKQPITRGEIEDVRGVQSGPMLRQLMDLRLVEVVGRNDELLGRPLLYGTTTQFLERFGLGSPADLPRKHELGA